MPVTWERIHGGADTVVVGEMERSGHVQDALCRKHQQAWRME